MENKKIYTIQINGVDQSINAVEALIKRLDTLDAQITKLESKKINIQGNVNVGTATSSGGDDNVRTIQEEAAIQKDEKHLPVFQIMLKQCFIHSFHAPPSSHSPCRKS